MLRSSITRTAAAAALTLSLLGAAAPGASAYDLGAPSIMGTSHDNVLFGTSVGDTIDGKYGRDVLLGRAGPDGMHGGMGIDFILPGPGEDFAYGEKAVDFVYDDDSETDKLSGGEDDDLLYAANGTKDYLDCGETSESDYGDIALVDAQDVVKHCEVVVQESADAGEGNQSAHYSAIDTSFLMGTNSGEYLMVGFTSSGAEDDWIAGKGGNDVINGLAGRDTLLAGDGEDYVYGGEGTDVVDDDNDRDVLSGHTGADTIYAANGVSDVIECGESTYKREAYPYGTAEHLDYAYVDPIDVVSEDCEVVYAQTKLV